MILIGIKDISSLTRDEIISDSHSFSPFYRDYILSPIEEKDGEIQLAHSASRLAAVQMLHSFCKQSFAKTPNFALGDNGKPYFAESSHVKLSFSHSGALSVCAVSVMEEDLDFDGCESCIFAPVLSDEEECVEISADGRYTCIALDCGDMADIGVDVQLIKKIGRELCYNHEKIAQRFFDRGQLERLSCDMTEKNFIRLWTELEGVAKMTGEGIGKRTRFTPPDTKIRTFSLADAQGAWYYLTLAYALRQHPQSKE